MSSRKWKRGCYPIKMDLKLIEEGKTQTETKNAKVKVEIVTELICFKLSLEEDCNLWLAMAFYTKQSALRGKMPFFYLRWQGYADAHCFTFPSADGIRNKFSLMQIIFKMQEISSTFIEYIQPWFKWPLLHISVLCSFRLFFPNPWKLCNLNLFSKSYLSLLSFNFSISVFLPPGG